MSIELKTPDASLIYTFEWQDAIPEGVDLVSVEHTVPEGLTLVAQQTDHAGATLDRRSRRRHPWRHLPREGACLVEQ
jgi:hypothetical protein